MAILHTVTQFTHVSRNPTVYNRKLKKNSLDKTVLKMWSQVCGKKSRIQETKHLSTNADSSTDAIGRWTKNTPKPDFFEKRKKIIQNEKTQKRLEICQNYRYALQPEVSNPSGSVVSGWTKNTQKPDFFLKNVKNIIQNAKTQKCLEICQN